MKLVWLQWDWANTPVIDRAKLWRGSATAAPFTNQSPVGSQWRISSPCVLGHELMVRRQLHRIMSTIGRKRRKATRDWIGPDTLSSFRSNLRFFASQDKLMQARPLSCVKWWVWCKLRELRFAYMLNVTEFHNLPSQLHHDTGLWMKSFTAMDA